MTLPLLPVKKLTIQIVVDNTVEWFTAFPPGFILELPQYLNNGPEVDPLTQVPFLDFEKTCCGVQGLSLLLTVERDGETFSLALDTGPDPLAFARNISGLKSIDALTIERVVLSHWHRDHSGSLTQLVQRLKEKRPGTTVVVDLHPDRPLARGFAPADELKPHARLRPDPTVEELQAAGGVIEISSVGHAVGNAKVKDAVWISGDIPRVTGNVEPGETDARRWCKKQGGNGGGFEWVREPHIMDERYVVVDVRGKGLVVISPCGHAGVINTVKDAMEKLPGRPVYMVVAGFHMAKPAAMVRLPGTIEYLRKLKPKYIVPLHCTGAKAKFQLMKEFGDVCVPAGAGMKIVLPPA